VFGEGEMADFDLGRVFCSQAVELALKESGINREKLLEEHQETEAGDGCWVASSFTLPKYDRTLWAITDLKKPSTWLGFEGL
jgi:hypothetical protein